MPNPAPNIVPITELIAELNIVSPKLKDIIPLKIEAKPKLILISFIFSKLNLNISFNKKKRILYNIYISQSKFEKEKAILSENNPKLFLLPFSKKAAEKIKK